MSNGAGVFHCHCKCHPDLEGASCLPQGCASGGRNECEHCMPNQKKSDCGCHSHKSYPPQSYCASPCCVLGKCQCCLPELQDYPITKFSKSGDVRNIKFDKPKYEYSPETPKREELEYKGTFMGMELYADPKLKDGEWYLKPSQLKADEEGHKHQDDSTWCSDCIGILKDESFKIKPKETEEWEAFGEIVLQGNTVYGKCKTCGAKNVECKDGDIKVKDTWIYKKAYNLLQKEKSKSKAEGAGEERKRCAEIVKQRISAWEEQQSEIQEAVVAAGYEMPIVALKVVLEQILSPKDSRP